MRRSSLLFISLVGLLRLVGHYGAALSLAAGDYAPRRKTLADADILYDGKSSNHHPRANHYETSNSYYSSSSNSGSRSGSGSRSSSISSTSSSSSRSSTSSTPTTTTSSTTTTIKPPNNNEQQEQEQELSIQQSEAIQLIQDGSNVFITGVAGTGKSLVLKRAIQHLQAKYNNNKNNKNNKNNNNNNNQYVALGPTGPAALALEGQTIHSFAGIGIPRATDDFEKAHRMKGSKSKWKALKVLILDEASMVSAEFFDRLSEVVSRIRNDPRPFGGIQLIICGDFLQLSPIPPRKTDVDQMIMALGLRDDGGNGDTNSVMTTTAAAAKSEHLFLNRGFLFQAHNWKAANFRVVDLQQVFRQQNRAFVDVLDQIRRGQLTPSGIDFLRQNCQRPLPPNEFGIRPTILHSKNIDVARENKYELNKLPGDAKIFHAVDTVDRERGAPTWADNQLKKNQFFTNCIAEKDLYLKIGSQVMLTKNEGRQTRTKGKKLVNGSRGKVIDFVTPAGSDTSNFLPGVTLYPVVQFVCGTKKVIQAETFQSRLVSLGTCSRLAIPLRLAWAITTHKAQGLTLDYVVADVGAVFAEAQTYVALSRASDENGLELRNFSPTRVRANKLALAFYRNPDAAFPLWDGSTTTDASLVIPTGAEQNVAGSKLSQTGAGKESNVSLEGKTVVFSGLMRALSRKKAESLVEQSGGLVRGSVSGKTNLLVLGAKSKSGRAATMGAAQSKAQSIIESGKNLSGLQILTEQEFLRFVR